MRFEKEGVWRSFELLRQSGHIAALAVWIACFPSAAQDTKVAKFPMKYGMVEFATASKNVRCGFVPFSQDLGGPELSCDRDDPSYVNIQLGPTNPAKTLYEAGDSMGGGTEHILQYGWTWTGGPFTCHSAETGLTCRHTNGHGFSISKKRIEVH